MKLLVVVTLLLFLAATVSAADQKEIDDYRAIQELKSSLRRRNCPRDVNWKLWESALSRSEVVFLLKRLYSACSSGQLRSPAFVPWNYRITRNDRNYRSTHYQNYRPTSQDGDNWSTTTSYGEYQVTSLTSRLDRECPGYFNQAGAFGKRELVGVSQWEYDILKDSYNQLKKAYIKCTNGRPSGTTTFRPWTASRIQTTFRPWTTFKSWTTAQWWTNRQRTTYRWSGETTPFNPFWWQRTTPAARTSWHHGTYPRGTTSTLNRWTYPPRTYLTHRTTSTLNHWTHQPRTYPTHRTTSTLNLWTHPPRTSPTRRSPGTTIPGDLMRTEATTPDWLTTAIIPALAN